MKKLSLQREGYNPEVVDDPLFMLMDEDEDKKSPKYRLLDEHLYTKIKEQKTRL